MENTIEVEESKGKNKGFTLIELLIVIVILGILAAVTVFAVRGITDKGQTSACQADKKTLETAIESYFAQYGGTTIVITPATLPGTTTVGGADAEATLKIAQFIRDVSPKYAVTAAGGLTVQDAACGTIGAAA